MAHLSPGSTRITTGTTISSRPVMLFGAIVWSSGAAGRLGFFHGSESAGARHAFSLVGAANISNTIMFPTPLPFPSGLHVALTTAGEGVVFWRPMTPEEEEAYL